MQVILLERVAHLGQMGETVNVRPGYARNYLLPRKKALRANPANIAYFEAQKSHLEAENAKRKSEAETSAKKMDGLKIVLVRQAGEAGHLYGSVSARDIADAVESSGHKIDRSMVNMQQPYKTIGLFEQTIHLHPEVAITVKLNIARSEEEAALQEKRGAAAIKSEQAEQIAAEEAAAIAAAQSELQGNTSAQADESKAEKPAKKAKGKKKAAEAEEE